MTTERSCGVADLDGAAAPRDEVAGTGCAKPSSTNHAIDGTRGIAVLSVMLFHCRTPGFESGWLGVDLFFVLSGFLITTLLVSEHERFGRISLKCFWARRFLRLMPTYFLYVAGVTIMLTTGPDSDYRSEAGWSKGGFIASLWLYFHNFVPGHGIWKWQELTRHLWTLSVEEQFYLVWPVAVVLAIRSRLFVWALAALVVGSIVYDVLVHPAPVAGFLVHTRGVGIAVGCLAALFVLRRPRPVAVLRHEWASVAAAAGCVAMFAVCNYAQDRHHAYLGRLISCAIPAFDVSAAVLVCCLWTAPASRTAGVLATRALAYLGSISYGVYLYQMAVLAIVQAALLPYIESWPRFLKFGARVGVFIGLTVALAAVSYALYERRFLRLKEAFRPRSTDVGAPAVGLSARSAGPALAVGRLDCDR